MGRLLQRLVLFSVLVSLAQGAGSTDAILRSIEVTGSPQRAKSIAEQEAERWIDRRQDRGDLESLLGAIGAGLVRDGWGIGQVVLEVDTLESGLHGRIELIDVEPSRLGDWVWDPPADRAVPPAGVWVPVDREVELRELLERVREEGHPFASIQILDVGVREGSMQVRASFQEGPLLRLTGLRFEGAGGTKPGYLERVSGLRRNDPIRPSAAFEARDRLERTGLFREVSGPWLDLAGSGKAALVYRMRSFAQNQVEGAAGYDGQRKTLSGFVHVELGNLFGTGRKLLAAWDRVDSDRSSLELGYREPYLLGLPISAELSLSQYLEDSTWTDDRVRSTLEAELGAGWAARIGLAWGRTVFSGEPSRRTTRRSTVLGVGVDRRREAGTRGERLDLEVDTGKLEASPGDAAREGSLARIGMLGEVNMLFGSRWQIRAEGFAGWVEGPDSLPRPEALGIGGGESLRGYAERQFRAYRYALSRFEGGVRLLPEGNRIYLFLDSAIFRPWPSGENRWKAGYGLGIRVRGAGGWVRLDYGVASGDPPTSGRLHFRLETRF